MSLLGLYEMGHGRMGTTDDLQGGEGRYRYRHYCTVAM
jgi:hypothetical protein